MKTSFVGGRVPLARLLPVMAVVAVLALSTGCGGSSAATSAARVDTGMGSSRAPTVLRAATLLPGQPVPALKGKLVLTLTGKISAANKGRTIVLDRDSLARMGLVQVRVYEPWEKKDTDFRGVWLEDVLKIAGAAPDTSKVRITALDDYIVDLKMADVRAGGILLATAAGDGSEIPVDKGGPTRIIFLNGVKAGANANQWVWSLKTIDLQ